MKDEPPLKQCSAKKFVMPPSVAIGNEAFTNFIKVMSLPSGERQAAFSSITNEEKAFVYKVKLALEFNKRPSLSREQKILILDSISTISADTYNKENPELEAKKIKQAQDFQYKALSIFSPGDIHGIFIGMNGERGTDVTSLKKYEEKLALPMDIRREVIRNASPSEKSEFWKAQMIYHLATAKLNKAQFEFIADIVPLLTIRAFDFHKDAEQPKNEETKALFLLEPKALELFSKEEAFAIFMGLGLHKEVPVSNDAYTSITSRPGWCQCNHWCGASQLCDSYPCRATIDGCGWVGGSPCLEVCV